MTSCSTRSTAVPSWLMVFTISITRSTTLGARPSEGSSIISSFGRAISPPGRSSRPTSNSTGVAPKPAVTLPTCSSADGASAIGRRGTFAVRFSLAPGVALAEVRLDDPGVVQDVGGWTFDERPSEIEDQRVGAHPDDHAHDVFDEHDRDPTFPHPPHHRECLLDLDVVQPGHHLIQQ